MNRRSMPGWTLLCCVSALQLACAKPQISTPHKPVAAATPHAVSVSNVPEALDAPAGVDAQALQSKVTKVTVYSDRARVTRQATTEVTSEPTVFAFKQLPGWVDDGSVRVSSSVGRIVDVRVERDFLARATDKNWQKAEAKNKELANQLAALDDELAVLVAQKNQIEAIKTFSLQKISADVASYGDVLTFISDALRATAKSRRETMQKRGELVPAYEASARNLAELKGLRKLEETTVLVTMQGKQAVPTTIDLTYMLPGATWEPTHELRVSTSDPDKVELVSFAVVTQTSGEDWGLAELSFATQSSTQSARIPELEALTLGDTHTASRILTSKMSSFSRAQQAFQGQNMMWNKMHQRSSSRRQRSNFEQSYQSNMEYLQVVQSKTVRIFESLQKRGTTAHFKANAAPSVRGDGHPVRMRIGGSSLKSTQRIAAAPEQSLNAARTVHMNNSTDQSFLPGKVSLYQDGAFLGMTDIDFIAMGESFSVFVSVEDQLKLSRKLDKKKSTLIRKKARNRMQVAFTVSVENLSSESKTLTLSDRIPVSENKEIRVENLSIKPLTKPNSQGLLHWKLTLEPKERREFRISYQVEYPASLILDAQRRRAREPSTSSRKKKYRIEEQLMDMEEQL